LNQFVPPQDIVNDFLLLCFFFQELEPLGSLKLIIVNLKASSRENQQVLKQSFVNFIEEIPAGGGLDLPQSLDDFVGVGQGEVCIRCQVVGVDLLGELYLLLVHLDALLLVLNPGFFVAQDHKPAQVSIQSEQGYALSVTEVHAEVLIKVLVGKLLDNRRLKVFKAVLGQREWYNLRGLHCLEDV